MNKLLHSLFLILLLTGFSQPARAERAETMLIPQRVVLENGQRYATLVIKNSGDATGEYTIELIDMEMQESGPIVQLPEGTPPTQFSAIPYVRIAPRSVTLKPGESQTLRILAQRREGMGDGEFRSHIKVRIVNDNVGASANPGTDLAITVKPNIVMVMPLILRNGQTQFTAGLQDPRLVNTADGREIQLYITRDGNRSAEGNLRVFQSRGGQLTDIGGLNGIPVYRPTPRRLVHVPLSGYTPGAPLVIRYLQTEKEGGAVLAETRLSP